VANIGALKSRDYETVFEDICRVVKASHPAKVKVILETGGLTTEEKIVGCTLSKLAGAHFVKTSTGFGPGGATVEDIALMRKIVGAEMGVKASGGVRTREDAERLARAGANRIGASASVAIVTGEKSDGKSDGKKRAAAGAY
jgi:deoxyribose-phosphate aldolase